MNNRDQTLKHGVLAALDRDRAKQLFAAAKDPAALSAFVDQLLDDQALRQQHQLVDLDGQADAVQAVLVDVAVEDDPQQSALELTLLGGRRLGGGDAAPSAWMVRPDIVPAIAQSLADLSETAYAEAWTRQFGSDSLPVATELLGKIRTLYVAAAETQAAVVTFRKS